MKSLFFFFLLINVVYFYFQSDWFNDPAPDVIIQQPVMSPGVERLTLLRERGLNLSSIAATDADIEVQNLPAPAKPKPAPKKVREIVPEEELITSEPEPEELPPRQVKVPEAACFTLGPFDQLAQTGRAEKAISVLGLNFNRRQESRRTPKGYWVYLPASVSYRSAQRKVKEMQKKGLKDLFIMGKGSHKNAISLGLFKSKGAADERFQKVRGMGLKAILEIQYRTTKQVWLDISVPGNQTATVANVTELAETFPKASLTQRKCN